MNGHGRCKDGVRSGDQVHIREIPMKPVIGSLGAFLFLATLTTAMPARARDGTRMVCPSGYSLVVGVCINDRSGDVVLPETK